MQLKWNEAKEYFGNLLEEQWSRLEEREKSNRHRVSDGKIRIAVCGGDGIGPVITKQAVRVLEYMLSEEIENGKIELRMIEGLTLENRLKQGTAIPEEVLEQIRECEILLKGPTSTPRQGDLQTNIESANVALRRELDLFANIRPVQIEKEGIDWTFFRENTEGSYAVGSRGIQLEDKLFVDFTIVTRFSCERIIRAAFEYARKNGKKRVSAITKANIIKATDGIFLQCFYQIAQEYPEIKADDWYIDIMTAKLLDTRRQKEFQVIVCPNLYGDIITDEAAQLQGGVGTAGSANVGDEYAMFEAIHGSAPRMVAEGREHFADPGSMIYAVEMLLNHIGYNEQAEQLKTAMKTLCLDVPDKQRITGHNDGITNEEFVTNLIQMI